MFLASPVTAHSDTAYTLPRGVFTLATLPTNTIRSADCSKVGSVAFISRTGVDTLTKIRSRHWAVCVGEGVVGREASLGHFERLHPDPHRVWRASKLVD